MGASARALAEIDLSLFGGQGWTAESDVGFMRPDGTDLTFRDVAWDTKPFKLPPYWGLRLTRSLERMPKWDLAFDYLHAKMYSDANQLVDLSGRRQGGAVSGRERIGDNFSVLEFTDGHNLLTANMLRKWQPLEAGRRFSSRPTVYLGGGVGVAIPHSEVTVPGSRTSEYQLAGPAAQFLAGVKLPFGERFALRTEYRLSWADLDSDLTGGGQLRTEALTQHLNVGIGFRFGGKD